MKRTLLVVVALAALSTASSALAGGVGLEGPGQLQALAKKGKSLGTCPLKHTDVTVDVAGFLARVTVRQRFHNPFKDKIEAVYTFPLSQNAAVDRMTMKIGDRLIEGQIKPREEARKIYQQAKAQGKVASLLDQERPNIFTQAVANIEPGVAIDITISYSETLDWKDGLYQFDFPMVVGPRYVPGTPAGPDGRGFAPPTDQVPDADRITPRPTRPEVRAGHDISVTVKLNAGLPIRHLESKQHEVLLQYKADDKSRAVVQLKDLATIPNKDFVLQYQTASERIEDTVLTHTDKRGSFFTLVLQPPKRVRKELIVPRELVFVIDKSGSMSGFPIETAKRAMRLCIEGLHPRDTFNLMTFEGGVGFCFEKPVPNTDENRRKALDYLASLQGSGGTEMMKAIHACLAGQDDPERLRVVCFMTDGYVGNDMAIIDAVRKNSGTARVFSFGIGKSVNRYLLDGIARAGRGEVQYILSEKQAEGAGEKFYQRVRTPVLADIKLDFGGLAVEEVYPPELPDLFSSTPVVVKGRYKQPGKGVITLKGRTGEGPFERKIAVDFPAEAPQNEDLAPLWARAKIAHLMDQDLSGAQRGKPNPAIKEEIVGLGLRYRLMTQYTSFVAVEHKRITEGGKVKTVAVPVEMPQGVSYEGVFGRTSRDDLLSTVGAYSGSALSGRGSGARRTLVAAGGGSTASESTVASGLRWLAEHQLPDGGWSFDHAKAPKCKGKCPNPGEAADARVAATSTALLPFLGAGQTHKTGKYKKTVKAGLYFLVTRMEVGPQGGRLADKDRSTETQALATLVLCEAYDMTGDKGLYQPAQQALNYVVSMQDEKTGGWPAKPGGPPSTTATAWSVLVLKSGYLVYLKIPPKPLAAAIRFLDSVQSEGRAFYGETKPGKEPRATAAALLARMLLGRKPNNPAMKAGIEYLGKLGPSKTDPVYNFFATQVMRHAGGDAWTSWNNGLRDPLVRSQAKQGHVKGSWWRAEAIGAKSGGRLHQTAMNLALLEVYYRHLPIFGRHAVDNQFPHLPAEADKPKAEPEKRPGPVRPSASDADADASLKPPEIKLQRLHEKLRRLDEPEPAPEHLLTAGGGTKATESSAASSLEWLAAHQMPDGGWSFDLRRVPGCKGQCGGSGTRGDARIAATSLALLAYLGAGQTHKTGKHKGTIKRGLYFLVKRTELTPEGAKLVDKDAGASGQALGTMVFCEAYAMTQDKILHAAAQQALDYLVAMQDPKTGGWPPAPGAPPSTTATAWSVLAMKSAHVAYLRLPPAAVKRADEFFNTVQSDGGAFYGETKAGKEPRATAAGLLCRAYMGWRKDNPALVRGVTYLGQLGPSKTDVVYNRLTSEIMKCYRGNAWTAWNPKMRDPLVASQAREGHEAGSWAPDEGPEGKQGGRLRQTALSAIVLEIPNWHVRDLTPPVVEEDFPD